jgi:prefoldin subunit 2
MSTAPAAPAEPQSQEEVVRRYQTMQAEIDKLVEKITELEFDRNEHKLVQETLEPLDVGRKAYRLVGGVLVERTVGEVLPSVKSNKENVSGVVEL